MKIFITGSIAYDYLMTFPGSFADQILPDQIQNLSLSFLVDRMDRRRGGCAPNIAYTLALLGERPVLMATAGADFGEYRHFLDQNGVDTSRVQVIADKFTASFFCSTDQRNSQIASFYTGAMANAVELSLNDGARPDLVIISPNDPGAMVKYAEECRTLGIPFIYDPGQQCARSSGEELAAGLRGAWIVIANDYEMGLIQQKTGLTVRDMLKQSEAVIVTRGEKGSTIQLANRTIEIPVVPEERIIDPTGVGDSYRSGLLKGLAVGADWETCGRLGSVAATYALEHIGGQSHRFEWPEFKQRYEANFGPLAFD